MSDQNRAVFEQLPRVGSPHSLGPAAIGDGGARSRQHHEGGREIQTQGGCVHARRLAGFDQKRNANDQRTTSVQPPKLDLKLGLVDRGEPLDHPHGGDFGWALTPQGGVVFVADYGEMSLDRIAELSKGVSLVAARAEGNDCTSSVWGYEDGRQIWSVATEGEAERRYDGEVEDRLIVQGDPPSQFAAIRDRHLAKRDPGDEDSEDFLFMAPLELAQALGGWAPEGEVGQDLQFFRVARSVSSATAGSGTRKPPLVLGLLILALAIAAALIWAS